MSNLDDVCVISSAQTLWKVKRKEIIFILFGKKYSHTHTHTPLGLFLIFLAIVKNYYFWCCVLGRWASSVAPWRKSLNPTVPALWLLAAEWMETQSDVPTGEKNVLFTDCFKAILVLLSDTQWSAGGKTAESEDDTNKTDPSRRETNKRDKADAKTSDSGQWVVVSKRVSLF